MLTGKEKERGDMRQCRRKGGEGNHENVTYREMVEISGFHPF